MAESEPVVDVEINHIPFNAQWDTAEGTVLARICNEWAQGGWALLRVVPHHQYESIAVFERRTYR